MTPSALRPLSVVNTDNRIIAGAARIRWEPILARWVSPSQRGFLPHRSMLHNVVDVEHDAMMASLSGPDPALILFDFAAAFPSIAHVLIHATFAHLGVTPAVRSLLVTLYDDSRCEIMFRGGRYPGFQLRSGIRQGCPLSPLIYVVVADALLRRLSSLTASTR